MENNPQPQKWTWEIAYKKWFFLRFFLLLVALGLCIVLAYVTFHKEPEYVKSNFVQPKHSIASTTLTSFDTKDWKTYKNDLYEFQYPPLFSNLGGNKFYDVSLTSPRGTINVSLKPGVLDPKKIHPPFDAQFIPEDELIKVKVGIIPGYLYSGGDAGGYSRFIDSQFDQQNILRISFNSCIECIESKNNVDPISEDMETINKILSTFTFTK